MDMITQQKNALGEFFMLSLDKEIYSREAIMKTCYTMTDDYFLHVVKVSDETTGICFYSKKEIPDEQSIHLAVSEFLQLLHDNQLRQIVHQETSMIHEEIVRKAFSPAVSLIDKQSESESLTILKSAV